MKKIISIFLVLMLSTLHLFSQTQTNFALTTQVVPVYPDKFYDYFDKGKVMLMVQSDPSNSLYKNIRLMGKFTGDNGIVVATLETYIPATKIFCAQGQLVIVQGFDLRKYFEPNNIYTENISKNELLNKPLPEGNYTFCFTAYADTAGIAYQVSPDEPRGCSSPFAVLNLTSPEPPQLIMPVCESKVKPLQPQNIFFSWLPVSVVTSPEYTFKLVELAAAQDPNIAIDAQSGNLFFETQTYTSTFLYGPSSPPLVKGKKYVWRITAKDLNNNITIKNNGRSEVCVFEYDDDATQQTTTSNFHLIAPADKSILAETPKGYEFKYSQTINGNYVLYFAEMQKGQSAKQSMQNAIANKTFFTETGKELPPTYTTFYVGNYDYKFKPGKSYAWCVKSDNEFTAETWSFNVPVTENDTLTISYFNINGFKVKVTKIDNPNPKYFGGTGKIDLFNDAWGPQANVSFSGLQLVNLSYDNTKGAKDWECALGTVDGDVLNFKTIPLNDKNNAGGNFSLVKGSKIKLIASKETKYDEQKKTYFITKTNEENKSQLRAQLIWETEIVPAEGGYNVGDVGSNSAMSNAMVISSFEMFIDFATDKNFNGTMQTEKQIQFKSAYPKNFEVQLMNPQFTISGKDVTPYLSGNIKVPDGRTDLDKDLSIDFTAQKSFHFTVDIPTYTISLSKFLSSANDKKVKSELTFSKVEVDLKTGGGIKLPEANVIMHFAENDITSTFTKGYNYGEGYFIDDTEKEPRYTKVNSFDVALVYCDVKIVASAMHLYSMSGFLDVPFVNQKADYEYTINDAGDGYGTVYFTGEESVVYNDAVTKDKLTVVPMNSNLLDDRIVLDADFNFGNSNNENLNVSGVRANQFYIKSDGEIGWYITTFLWTNFLNPSPFKWRAVSFQPTGNFSGFVYKVKSLGINYIGNKQYKFATSGDIVLEEASLSTKNFDVYMSFAQPGKNKSQYENTLTASLSKTIFTNGATELTLPATGVELQPQGIKTSYHDGNLDVDVTVKYFKNDGTFGNGFMTEEQVGVKTPIEKSVYGKTLIGKVDGFNYWFMQGKYIDEIGVPTGFLDLVAYEFDGRFYYNMYHPTNVLDLSNNAYTPKKGIGLGLFALAKLKTEASNGGALWATGAIKLETGSKTATFYCTANLLNADGANGSNSLIKGDGEIAWCFSPLNIDGTIRMKQKFLGSFVGVNVGAHFFIDPSMLQLDVNAPMKIEYIGVDANITAGVKMTTDLKCNVNAGFAASLSTGSKDLGVCSASASINLNASMNGEFKYGIPFSIGGTGGLTADASCGSFGGSVGVTGSYQLPSPFCISAGMSFSVPYPSICCHCIKCVCPAPCIDYYPLNFGARWKTDANPVFSFTNSCQ